MGHLNDLRKYIDYLVDRRSFEPSWAGDRLSDLVLGAAMSVRGGRGNPALFVHGIMPRSGTVYVGELLRRHPVLYAYPNEIWEVPFLQHTDHVLAMARDFLRTYEQNVGKIGRADFLPLFGEALVAYLQSFAPAEKRVLLKVPGVHHLDRFFATFPHEHLLVLVRDGRDVVQSTRRTWPQITFGMACRRWKRSARMVLACRRRFSERTEGYWLARFEDAVRDPASFVRQACARFGLDPSAYPLDDIGKLPVRGSTTLGQGGKVKWTPVEKPKDFDPIGHWREWSWWRRWRFKCIAGRELIELGYASDLNW